MDPRHQHHHHREEDDERRGYDAPPPGPYPPVQHVAHEYAPGYAPGYAPPPDAYPPPPGGYGAYPPPPSGAYAPPPAGGYGGAYGPPAHSGPAPHGWAGSALARKPTVKIFPKAEPNYSLTIRNGSVALARANPRDEFQHWIKDLKWSTQVKDEEGFPAFALVNKATGQAIKHSVGAQHPVRLIPYNPDYLDESVLWAESKDMGHGFRCIRMVNNIRLNLDAFHGDKHSGGIHDGTTVVLWEWKNGDNQVWKLVPYWYVME